MISVKRNEETPRKINEGKKTAENYKLPLFFSKVKTEMKIENRAIEIKELEKKNTYPTPPNTYTSSVDYKLKQEHLK